MSPATRWLLAIVGLLAANVVAMVILAVTSSANPPQVIPGYDQRAAPDAAVIEHVEPR